METTFYELLGREPGIRALVDRFYDYMHSDPEAAEIRKLHAKDLRVSREKLFLFADELLRVSRQVAEVKGANHRLLLDRLWLLWADAGRA